VNLGELAPETTTKVYNAYSVAHELTSVSWTLL